MMKNSPSFLNRLATRRSEHSPTLQAIAVPVWRGLDCRMGMFIHF